MERNLARPVALKVKPGLRPGKTSLVCAWFLKTSQCSPALSHLSYGTNREVGWEELCHLAKLSFSF